MDFVSWLEGLPQETATKLYASHWACQAVLRGLPPLAKQYVLRLLFLDGPVPTSAPALVSSGLSTESHAAPWRHGEAPFAGSCQLLAAEL